MKNNSDTTNTQNILEVKNLTNGFWVEDPNNAGKKEFYTVLDDISLSFKKGKIHAIAGESGCGKSVFINTILRLLPKNAQIKSGEILFYNNNIATNPQNACLEAIDILKLTEKEFRKYRGNLISLIPQNPFASLNPLYTIENQISENTILNQLNKKEKLEIIKNALDEVRIKNINTVLSSYPHELSGGMKQRVIIAMSLVQNAELILADEPTTALDVSVSNSILELLLNLKEKGKTVILITHDLSIVSNYCDEATLMYLGNIVETADCKTLFSNPRHPYTKALLSALPSERKERLENIKGQIAPLGEIIEGCKFHPRCKYVMEKCKYKKPFLYENCFGKVACWLYNKE